MRKRYFIALIALFVLLLVIITGCSASTFCKQCNAKIESNAAFCSNCGAAQNDEQNTTQNNTQAHVHDFSKKVTTDAYLKADATCKTPATYNYSCECGEKSTDTFTYGETLPHSYTSKIQGDKYLCSKATNTSPAKYYYACSTCLKRGTTTYEHGTRLLDLWGYNYYVDNQFGEETDEWYVTTHEPLDGTFENSATTNAPLLVKILYDCNDEISIFLYEYADMDNLVKNASAKYKDYYKIVVKNEKGETYEARGQMHPGGDRIYIIDTYHNGVLNLMKTSETLKFYIQYEDSPTTQYRFELDMNNFNDAVADMQ